MKADLEISVFEVVGSSLCVSSNDGQKVYDRLAAALKENKNVLLSFRHIAMLTSAFLNAAIGQLYGEFEEEKIRSSVNVDMLPDDLELLKRVVDTAKLYFKDTQKFDRAIRRALEDNDEPQSKKS